MVCRASKDFKCMTWRQRTTRREEKTVVCVCVCVCVTCMLCLRISLYKQLVSPPALNASCFLQKHQ